MNAAIEAGEDVLLGSGTYIIPDSAQGKTLTIVGNGNTVIAHQIEGGEGADYAFDGSTVTFKNVIIESVGSGLPSDTVFIGVWPAGNYHSGYARMKGTYENCVINNMYVLYGDSTFTNCTFNVDTSADYNVRTWGAVNATFEDCTFNSMGRAIDFCASNGDTLTVTNCVFNDNGSYDPKKAAIEVGDDYNATDCTLIINNVEVNGFSVTAPKGDHGGTSLGTTVWGNKDRMPSTNLNVVIDGVDVY